MSYFSGVFDSNGVFCICSIQWRHWIEHSLVTFCGIGTKFKLLFHDLGIDSNRMSKLTRKYGFTILVLSVIALCLSAIFMPNVNGQNPIIGNKTFARNYDMTQSL
jgi:hypothetical protein